VNKLHLLLSDLSTNNHLPRPVPYEIDLAQTQWVMDLATRFGAEASDAASILVKLSYAGLFLFVLAIVMWLSERALNSPWGRMMRAIRDNKYLYSAVQCVVWREQC